MTQARFEIIYTDSITMSSLRGYGNNPVAVAIFYNNNTEDVSPSSLNYYTHTILVQLSNAIYDGLVCIWI